MCHLRTRRLELKGDAAWGWGGAVPFFKRRGLWCPQRVLLCLLSNRSIYKYVPAWVPLFIYFIIEPAWEAYHNAFHQRERVCVLEWRVEFSFRTPCCKPSAFRALAL